MGRGEDNTAQTPYNKITNRGCMQAEAFLCRLHHQAPTSNEVGMNCQQSEEINMRF